MAAPIALEELTFEGDALGLKVSKLPVADSVETVESAVMQARREKYDLLLVTFDGGTLQCSRFEELTDKFRASRSRQVLIFKFDFVFKV